MSVTNRTEYIDEGSRNYISKMMALPLVSREREYQLAKNWRDKKDEKSLHELVSCYGRYVVKIASGFKGYGLPLADLIQEGNIGLMEAAARFDPERKARFSTYAMWWISAAIQDYVLRNSSIVRIATTATQKSLFFNLRKIRTKLASNTNDTMSDKDRLYIAQKLKVPLAAVERMEAYLSHPDQSLNISLGAENKEQLIDFLRSEEPDPENNVIYMQGHQKRSDNISQAIKKELTDREKYVISKRFMSDERMTLTEIGKKFGLTKERIRQIEKKALEKLKSNLRETFPEAQELIEPV